MSIIKTLIQKTYGIRSRFSKVTGIGIYVTKNKTKMQAQQSFYSLPVVANNGTTENFEKFRGKKILIVNLASQCGYTPQYEELENLYKRSKDNLVILGFPSNDFGGQEPGSDEEIATFCKVNFGVTFFLYQKDHVAGNIKQPVYQWLSDPAKNGWNSKEPSWNFCKYLIDEEGTLTHIFSAAVSPLSDEIVNQIK
ncbi:glutathione peroxidase [soil metagenome]